MSKVALIDADLVAYRCAASAENDPLDVALERADSLIDRIMQETGAATLHSYLSGPTNFREAINPMYKANRKDKPKPRWLQDVREHLVVGWGTWVTDGIEADDALGISQCQGDGDTVIVTNDKDLLQIPGHHFNPVTGDRRIISPHEGLQNFYFQMIMGDTSDNIFGFDGKARSKIPKFLEPTISYLMNCETELDMYEYVHSLYSEWGRKEFIEMNAQCLYIQKKENDKWQEPEKHHLDSSPA